MQNMLSKHSSTLSSRLTLMCQPCFFLRFIIWRVGCNLENIFVVCRFTFNSPWKEKKQIKLAILEFFNHLQTFVVCAVIILSNNKCILSSFLASTYHMWRHYYFVLLLLMFYVFQHNHLQQKHTNTVLAEQLYVLASSQKRL